MSESYREREAECGIKKGDTVMIMRKANSKENGWGNSWDNFGMDELIGKKFVVRNIPGISDMGIALTDRYKFPYFILSIVKKAEKPIAISTESISDYFTSTVWTTATTT